MQTLHQSSGYYSTTDGHQLYWERHGNLGGEPVFFIHGGPGGSCNEKHLLFFDLKHVDAFYLINGAAGAQRPKGD